MVFVKGLFVMNIEKSKLNHSIQSKIIPNLQRLWLEIFQGRAYTHFSGVAGQRGSTSIVNRLNSQT